MAKLTVREIDLLINYYIGCYPDGNLMVFTEPEDLRAFLQVWCDLDINPTSKHASQVRNEFVELLNAQTPLVQAKILRIVINSIPIQDPYAPHTRNMILQEKMTKIIKRLESTTVLIESVTPRSASEVVQIALKDADHLIGRGSARSAVDRTHTALHGYLKGLCDEEGIQYSNEPGMPELYKLVRAKHPALQSSGPRQQDIDNICRTLGNIVDKLGPIRNRATPVHPQDELIEEPEAILAINAARALFHYVEEKRAPRGQSLIQRLFSRR